MPTNAIATARFSIAGSVSAWNLYRFTALVHDLYVWHALMDHMDAGPVENPTSFLPPRGEQLMVNRADIGSPNLIELFGLAKDLLPSLAHLGEITKAALVPLTILTVYWKGRKAKAEAIKTEEELGRARQEHRVGQTPILVFFTESDPMFRTMRHHDAFKPREIEMKQRHLRETLEPWALELIGPFAKDVTLTVFGDAAELAPRSASPSSPPPDSPKPDFRLRTRGRRD